MSKLRSDKISFDNDDFIIEVEELKPEAITAKEPEPVVEEEIEEEPQIDESELILNRARAQAQELINEANEKASEIIQKAQQEALEEKQKTLDEAHKKAQDIIKEADKNAQEALENSKSEIELLLQNSAKEIEQKRIEETKLGYEEGYQDAKEKIQEELEEKISAFDTFCLSQFEAKNKILKTAGKDIFDIIAGISKKILLKEPEASTLEEIIRSTIALFEKKENIKIILSEKYARILFELQKHSLGDDIELNFEEFKQFDNFELLYNPNLKDDTIIVENLSERYCASLEAQLDVIIRDILKNSKNGYLDTKDYSKDEA